MSLPSYFFNTFDLNVGSYSLAIPYVQAGAIIFLLFLLVITMAQFRHHYLDWSFKGAGVGLIFGVLITLILEGFLLVYGKTALISVLGWENAPKPISVALEAGRNKLSNVLGEKTEEKTVGTQEIVKLYQSLSPSEVKKIKNIICSP